MVEVVKPLTGMQCKEAGLLSKEQAETQEDLDFLYRYGGSSEVTPEQQRSSYLGNINRVLCFLDSEVDNNPKFRVAAIRSIIRLMELLIDEGLKLQKSDDPKDIKRAREKYEEALDIINALEGNPVARSNSVTEAAIRLKKAIETNQEDFYKIIQGGKLKYSLGNYQFKKGEIYKGLGNYTQALTWYALCKDSKIESWERFDYTLYAKMSYLEVLAQTRKEGHTTIKPNPEEILSSAKSLKEEIDKLNSTKGIVGIDPSVFERKKEELLRRPLEAYITALIEAGEYDKAQEIIDAIQKGDTSGLGDVQTLVTPGATVSDTNFANVKLWNLVNFSPLKTANDVEDLLKKVGDVKDAEERQKMQNALIRRFWKEKWVAKENWENGKNPDDTIFNDTKRWADSCKLTTLKGEVAWDLLIRAATISDVKDKKAGWEGRVITLVNRALDLKDNVQNNNKANFMGKIVLLLGNADDLQRALAIAVEWNLFKDVVVFLKAKMNKIAKTKGKQDPEYIKNQNALIALLKILISGYKNIKDNPEWLVYIEDLKGVVFNGDEKADEKLNKISISNSILDDNLWLAAELRATGEKRAQTLADREYVICERQTREDIAGQDARRNILNESAYNLARALEGKGTLGDNLGNLREAGYILQELLSDALPPSLKIFSKSSTSITSAIRVFTLEVLKGETEEDALERLNKIKIEALGLFMQIFVKEISAYPKGEKAETIRLALIAYNQIKENPNLKNALGVGTEAQIFILAGKPAEAAALIYDDLKSNGSSFDIEDLSRRSSLLSWAYEEEGRRLEKDGNFKDAAIWFMKSARLNAILLTKEVNSLEGYSSNRRFDSLFRKVDQKKEPHLYLFYKNKALFAENYPEEFSTKAVLYKVGEACNFASELGLAIPAYRLALMIAGEDTPFGKKIELRIISAYAKKTESLLKEADDFILAGQRDAAINIYQQILSLKINGDVITSQKLIDKLNYVKTLDNAMDRKDITQELLSLAWLAINMGKACDALKQKEAALSFYKIAIDADDVILTDIGLLASLSDVDYAPSKEEIILSKGGLYQSIGSFDEAITAFDEAIEVAEKTDSYNSRLVLTKANLGKGEVLLAQSKKAEKSSDRKREIDAAFYCINYAFAILKDIEPRLGNRGELPSGGDLRVLNRQKEQLVSDLFWALNAYADWQKTDDPRLRDKLVPAEAALLTLMKRMDGGDISVSSWPEIVNWAKNFGYLNIEEVSGFISVNSDAFKSYLKSGSFRFSYVSALASSKLFKEALDQYALAKKMSAIDGGHEARSIGATITVGDVLCFEGGFFKDAKPFYDQALLLVARELVEKYNNSNKGAFSLDLPENLEDVANLLKNRVLQDFLWKEENADLLKSYLSVCSGRGKIYVESGRLKEAVFEYNNALALFDERDFSTIEKELVSIYVSSLMSLAGIYVYETKGLLMRKNLKKAIDLYEKAYVCTEQYLKEEIDEPSLKASSRLGSGDAQRLINFDFVKAENLYLEGINLLKPLYERGELEYNDKKTLSQLYFGYGMALSKQRGKGDDPRFPNRGEAAYYLRLAKIVLENASSKPYDKDHFVISERLGKGDGDIEKNREGLLSSASATTYVKQSGYQENMEGYRPGGRLEFVYKRPRLNIDASIDFAPPITSLFDVVGPYDEKVPRLTSGYFKNFHVGINYENNMVKGVPALNLRGSILGDIQVLPGRIYGYTWSENYGAYVDPVAQDQKFHSLKLGLIFGFDYKKDISESLLFMGGLDAEGYLGWFNKSPYYLSAVQTFGEFAKDKVSYNGENLSVDEALSAIDRAVTPKIQDRISGKVEPHIQLLYSGKLTDSIYLDTSIRFGGGVGLKSDPVYPLMDIGFENDEGLGVTKLLIGDTRDMRLFYGSLGISLNPRFGSDYKLSFPFSVNVDVGNIFNLNSSLGLRRGNLEVDLQLNRYKDKDVQDNTFGINFTS